MSLKLSKITFLLILSFLLILPINAFAAPGKSQTNKSNEYVNIPDPNLRDALLYVMGKNSGESITVEELQRFDNADKDPRTDLEKTTHYIQLSRFNPSAGVTFNYIRQIEAIDYVDLSSNGIKDLKGIEHLQSVETLDLSKNEISDLTPLQGLTNLKHLILSDNQIEDVSPLSFLENLEVLVLTGNKVKDVSSLNNNQRLKWIDLNHNELTSIEPLANIKEIEVISAEWNQIKTIPDFANNKNLKVLKLDRNEISDLSPLAGKEKLLDLTVSNNNITSIHPLNGLKHLRSLYIGENPIDVNDPRNIDAHDFFLYNMNELSETKQYNFSATDLPFKITNPVYIQELEEQGKFEVVEEPYFDLNAEKEAKELEEKMKEEEQQLQREKERQEREKERKSREEQKKLEEQEKQREEEGKGFIGFILKLFGFIVFLLITAGIGFALFLVYKRKQTLKDEMKWENFESSSDNSDNNKQFYDLDEDIFGQDETDDNDEDEDDIFKIGDMLDDDKK